jgi:transposase
MTDIIYVGLDIGKKNVDVAVPVSDKGYNSFRISNNESGFQSLEKQLMMRKAELQKKKINVDFWLVSEATGIYYMPIHEFFVDKGWRFTVVNPLVIKEFRKIQLENVKTDKQDAKLIAKYGAVHHKDLQVTPKTPLEVRKLEQLQVLRRTLQRYMVGLHSAKENISFAQIPNGSAETNLQEQQEYAATKLKAIEKEMIDAIKKVYPAQYKCIVSITGVGVNMIIEICIETNFLQKFKNLNQFLAYAGVVPNAHESGSSVYKKPTLAQIANRSIRRAAYLAALSATKHNIECKNLHDRLPEKLSPKQKLMHVGRKLATQIWYCVRNLETYKVPKDRVKVGERKVGELVVELVYEEPQSALRSMSNDNLISSFESGK